MPNFLDQSVTCMQTETGLLQADFQSKTKVVVTGFHRSTFFFFNHSAKSLTAALNSLQKQSDQRDGLCLQHKCLPFP